MRPEKTKTKTKTKTSTNRKRALESKVRQEEDLVKARERELLEESAMPRSEEDFERLVAGSPSSSFLWIQFMGHLISVTEFDKARAVAEVLSVVCVCVCVVLKRV
jgi:rRNA biogenesis protein RRP5